MTPPLVVAVHHSLRASQPEIEFVLRTLFTIAGYAIDVIWTDGSPCAIDVYYGPAMPRLRPSIWIPSCAKTFTDAPTVTASSLITTGLSPRLILDDVHVDARGQQAERVYEDDILFASYWLLAGAREPFAARSTMDDLDLSDSPLIRNGVLDLPLVSIWGTSVGEHFRTRGAPSVPAPWAADGKAAFAFTHDVDYPEIIRWIEAPRHVLRGHTGIAWKILTGRSDHWTFEPWVALAGEFGTAPCFYFMARQGSLVRYAMGTPDDFYDVRTPRFTDLLATLRDAGAEIGLHASFHAHRDAGVMRHELERLRTASRGPVYGNRHHYWHLDPDDPNATLARHEEAGLEYDSSLGLEYYPGFRRAICHPFRPYHPGRRQIIDVVQLPPAWMDDHFDRRLSKNGILDPDDAARRLVAAAARTGGIIVVDYHSRGMNREIFPRWGAWLERFVRAELPGLVTCRTPHEIATGYRVYAHDLAAASRFWTREG